ncbi:hypothetical protein [Streptomyces werraensis]|uniref:hypothetical protein n=1 Tax=Streptomyces werraensis TaxID=68284 RepID=UPI0037CEF60A
MAETIQYFRTADGVLASRKTTADAEEPQPLPEGATALTEEEYETALAAVEEARQQHAEELIATDRANQLADYTALRTSGIPEATARRLTGYEGPDVEN